MQKFGLATFCFVMMATPAMAGDFDACVLAHMQGVTSDFAAKSIKQSCVRTAEQEIPVSVITQARAFYGSVSYGYTSDPRLVISINNGSGYSISEITVNLERKGGVTQSYVVRRFPHAPHLSPGALALPPSDPTTEMIIGPGSREFWVEVSPSPDSADFKSNLVWDVISAKGWKD